MNNKTNLLGYPIVIIITAVLTFLFSTCNREDKTKGKAPKEIISYEDAVELYDSYSENRACLIETFEGKKDSILDNLCPSDRKPIDNFIPSRSFYLEKRFLKRYMAYVNRITPDTMKITGYRLYLGNYPDKSEFNDGKPIPDPRRNTFFIAPTTQAGGSDIHRGFTFVDQNNDGIHEVLFLEDELGRGRRSGQNTNSPKGKINTASFFSFVQSNGGRSTIGNELGGHPPTN